MGQKLPHREEAAHLGRRRDLLAWPENCESDGCGAEPRVQARTVVGGTVSGSGNVHRPDCSFQYQLAQSFVTPGTVIHW